MKANHPLLFFNGNPVIQTDILKHLRLFRDTKLSFLDHLKTVFEKTNKTIGLPCKLRLVLARSPLFITYKSFVRPHFDYRDIIYGQTYDTTFHQKMEAMWYTAALAITVATTGPSKE